VQSLKKMLAPEEKRVAAWMARDKEAIRKQLDDDSFEINIYGRFTKRQILEKLFPKVRMLKFKISEPRVLDTGPDSCGINYRVGEQIKSGGKMLSFDCYVTAVYRKRGRRWLLLLWQITPSKK
jgi:hypothetical protein